MTAPVHRRRHIGYLGKAHRTSGSRSIRKRQPVHPSLDHVDSHRGDLVDLLPRVVDRLSYDRCAGGVKTGPIERFAFLLVVHLDAFESVVAEALDGRDAVLSVEPQLLDDLLTQWQLLVPCAEVPMRIDEPGHDGFSRHVDWRGPGGNPDRGRRADRLDAAIGDHDCRLLDRRAAGAIDHSPAGQDHGAIGRCLRERGLEREHRQRQQAYRRGSLPDALRYESSGVPPRSYLAKYRASVNTAFSSEVLFSSWSDTCQCPFCPVDGPNDEQSNHEVRDAARRQRERYTDRRPRG